MQLSASLQHERSRRTVLPAAMAIAAAIVIGAPGDASACSCVPRSPCSIFAATDAVFLGHVVEVRREGGYNVARLDVVRTWRGTVDATVTVREGAGTTCSFDVEVGDRFLVYGQGSGATFSTSMCAGGGVLPEGEPEPDLPPRGGRVTGQVLRFNEAFTSRDDLTSPLADTRVSIQAGDKLIETRTDPRGWFTLDGVPAGEHTLRADVGSGLAGTERITLQSTADCATALIIPEPSGRLSGRLSSSAGLPLKEVEVYAVPVAHDWSVWELSDTRTTRAGPDGAFEFSGLEPGKYFLMVNVVYPPQVSQPYAPTYYPGVANREDAVAVEVGSGSAPLSAPFALDRTLPRSTIAVDIVCRDASMPRSGLAFAKRTESRSFFNESTYTKADGYLQLTVMAGVIYDIHGEVLVPSRDDTGREIGFHGLRTSEVRFDPAAPPPVVRLVAPLDRCHQTTIDGSRR